MFYVVCVKQKRFATDLEVGEPFIGLEISSRTPCFAVGGIIRPVMHGWMIIHAPRKKMDGTWVILQNHVLGDTPAPL